MELTHWVQPRTEQHPFCSLPGDDAGRFADDPFGGALVEDPTDGFPQAGGRPLVLGERFWWPAARAVLDARPELGAMDLELRPVANTAEADALRSENRCLGLWRAARGAGREIAGLEPLEGSHPAAEAGDGQPADLCLAVLSVPRRSRAGRIAPLDPLETETALALWQAAGPSLQPLAAREDCRVEIPLPPAAPDPRALPWNDALPRLYRDRWEENLLERLPLLWLDGPGAPELRWRYRRLLAERIEAQYLAPFRERAREAGLRLAASHPPVAGGCEDARQQWDPENAWLYEVDFLLVRDAAQPAGQPDPALVRAASIARQAGSTRRLIAQLQHPPSAPAGLPALRAQCARLLIDGAGRIDIGSRPGHLRGDARRCANRSLLHPAQPWWPQLEELNTQLARLTEMLEQGRPQIRVLLLTPDQSCQALTPAELPESLGLDGPSPLAQKAAEIDEQYQRLLQGLFLQGIVFDVVGEELLRRHGKADANCLRVGQMEYTIVILPPALSWRSETVKVLRRFARRGGSLLLVQPVAKLVDMRTDPLLEQLPDNYMNAYPIERAGREAAYQIQRLDPRVIQFRSAGEENPSQLHLAHRGTQSHEIFVVTNASPGPPVETQVRIEAEGALRRYDLETGASEPLEAEDDRGTLVFDYAFHHGQPVVFAVGGNASPDETPVRQPWPPTRSEALPEEWEFDRLDPNLCPLRLSRYAIDTDPSGIFQPLEFHRIAIHDELRRGGEDAPLAIEFSFGMDLDATGLQLDLLLEDAEGLQVRCNDQPVAPCENEEEEQPLGYRRYALDAQLQTGDNLLRLDFPSCEKAALEMPVLAGDFAVALDKRGRPELRREPDRLRNGSWTEQGYPYYAGRIRYRALLGLERVAGCRRLLTLPGLEAGALQISVGKYPPQTLLGQPWSLELTPLLDDDYHEIAIEVAGSLENLYGAIHLAPRLADDPATGPEALDRSPADDRRLWNRTPRFRPFGLIQGARLDTFDPKAPKPKPASAKQKAETDEADEAPEQEEPQPPAEPEAQAAETQPEN